MEPNSGQTYWEETLKRARYVVAPMVDQSELAWRLLCRKHGAQLCYTPMFHASNYIRDAIYRRDNFQTCPEDRPLIVQFCANDPEILVKACKLVEPFCDGVDLNLGCPQAIAKRGHYGSFLQDEWSLISRMVTAVHESVSVPISCKVRIFEDIDKTVEYAKMLEAAGCQLLTVHGRTREQKGRTTGVADWKHVKAVKKAVKIPVFSNGNIQYMADVDRCLEETNVDGVMSAEGILHNPFLFEQRKVPPPCWQPALEYLDLFETYPCPTSFVRGHLFKVLHHSLLEFTDLREKLATADTVEGFKAVANEIRSRCEAQNEEYVKKIMSGVSDLAVPHWLCQPYVRPTTSSADEVQQIVPAKDGNADDNVLVSASASVKLVKKRQQMEIDRLSEEFGVSKKRAKKMIKHPERPIVEKQRRIYVICECGNPLSNKCSFKMCKTCCRIKLIKENAVCDVHRLHTNLIKS
jgi:tRNA-dihydrouridine synthase 1